MPHDESNQSYSQAINKAYTTHRICASSVAGGHVRHSDSVLRYFSLLTDLWNHNRIQELSIQDGDNQKPMGRVGQFQPYALDGEFLGGFQKHHRIKLVQVGHWFSGPDSIRHHPQ